MVCAAKLESVTFRFLRDVRFQRFSVRAGEIWRQAYRPSEGGALDAIESGADRFPFAGSQCLLSDIEIIHRGAGK